MKREFTLKSLGIKELPPEEFKSRICAKSKLNFETPRSWMIHMRDDICNNPLFNYYKVEFINGRRRHVCKYKLIDETLCNKDLSCYFHLKKHMGLDHVEIYKSAFLEDFDRYKCQEKDCIFKTISRVTFERHRQRVHKKKYEAETGNIANVFKCEIWPQELVEEHYLKQHYRAKHKDDYINRFFEDPEYFYCSICSKEFTNYHCLDRHMSFHHSDKYMNINDITYDKHLCSHCLGRFLNLSRHIIDIHPEFSKKEIKTYNCPNCSQKLKSRDNLNQHMKIHGEKKYSCGICNKSFSTHTILYSHKFTHEEKKFTCEVCEFKFREKKHLNQHKKEKKKQCYKQDCKVEVKSRCEMVVHIESHYEYRCQKDGCNKDFIYLCSLQAHVRNKHTNKKLEYKCKHCSDVFTNRYLFIQHNSTHKKKNYVCEVCGLAYHKNWYLERHKKKSAKPMKCRIKECNFETRSHCELQIHRPDHWSHKCSEHGCGKAYTISKELNKHIEKHHKNKNN